MTIKTVGSVIDEINEWDNPKGGTVYYVTCFFTDGDMGSVGRKDMDAALEVRGLLQEAIGQERDFILEPKPPTKSGKAKWKIVGFGTVGGAPTYTAPGAQGGAPSASVNTGPRSRRSPDPSEQASIRASVALKAAVDVGKEDVNAILEYADAFNAWLFEKSSESVSEYTGSSPIDHQAADSETVGEGDAALGKEPAPSPAQPGKWEERWAGMNVTEADDTS